MKIMLVRAGRVDVAADTLIGHSDPPLAADGFTAIQRLAATWSGPAPRFLFSSDLRRAAQCAQVFASHFALEPLPDRRLRELDCGLWNGQTPAAIRREGRTRYAAWQQRWILEPAPEGESFTDVMQRTGTWLSAVVGAAGDHDVVLAIAHQGSIRALLCHALGLPPRNARRLAVARAGVTAIGDRGGQFEVSLLNATSFQDPSCDE